MTFRYWDVENVFFSFIKKIKLIWLYFICSNSFSGLQLYLYLLFPTIVKPSMLVLFCSSVFWRWFKTQQSRLTFVLCKPRPQCIIASMVDIFENCICFFRIVSLSEVLIVNSRFVSSLCKCEKGMFLGANNCHL